MTKILAILLIASFSVVAIVESTQSHFLGLGQKPVCVNNGDYCRDNADCCSNTCASSRCMMSNAIPVNTNQVNVVPTQRPTQQPPPVVIDDRFNPNEDRNCQGRGSQCSQYARCCNFLTCERSVCQDRSMFVVGTETFGYDKNNAFLSNRFNDEGSQPTRPARPAACGDLGAKCFNPSDCCTPYKCHSFLHQCVT